MSRRLTFTTCIRNTTCIVKPNSKFVCEEAVRVTMDMITNQWQDKAEVTYDNVNDMTLQVALLVIGSAGTFGPSVTWKCQLNIHSALGFGRRITIAEDLKVPPGHDMSFRDALPFASENMIIPLVLPKWAMGLTQHLCKVRTAFANCAYISRR